MTQIALVLLAIVSVICAAWVQTKNRTMDEAYFFLGIALFAILILWVNWNP